MTDVTLTRDTSEHIVDSIGAKVTANCKYALVVEKDGYGEITTLNIHRHRWDGGEELKIAINIEKKTAKSTRNTGAIFRCGPEIADMIAEACKTPRG
jgi:hypothetical protein